MVFHLKSCCCCFTLRTGTIVSAVIILIVALADIYFISVDAEYYGNHVFSSGVYNEHTRTTYACVVAPVLFCIFVFFVHIWLIWGVCHRKTSVVFAGCLIQAIFLLVKFIAFVMMLALEQQPDFVTFISKNVVFVVFYVVMLYLLAVSFSYWWLLKNKDWE